MFVINLGRKKTVTNFGITNPVNYFQSKTPLFPAIIYGIAVIRAYNNAKMQKKKKKTKKCTFKKIKQLVGCMQNIK